jgi:hypothetical protein
MLDHPFNRVARIPWSRRLHIPSPRLGGRPVAKPVGRPIPFIALGIVLLIGAAVGFVQEGSGLLDWLFGGFATYISKALKVILWLTAGSAFSLHLLKTRSVPKWLLWLVPLGVLMAVSALLGGSSLAEIVTELMFLPVVILTGLVAGKRIARRALLGLLIVMVLTNLVLTFAPPKSYTAIKIESNVTKRMYGVIYLADEEKGSRYTGLFLYPSVSGSLSLVGYQLSEALPMAGILGTALRLACMFGCVVSLQRAVYLGLAGAFVLSLVLGGRARIRLGRRLLRLAAEIAVLIIAFAVAWRFVPTPLEEGIRDRLSEEKLSSSSDVRIYSNRGWLPGLEGILAAPILGASAGKFAAGADGRFIGPHNVLVFVGAKHGVPAMLLFALLLAKGFRGLLRYVRSAAADGERNWAAALCASFVGCVSVCLFNPGYGPLYFWVIVGIGLAFSPRRSAKRSLSRSLPTVGARSSALTSGQSRPDAGGNS